MKNLFTSKNFWMRVFLIYLIGMTVTFLFLLMTHPFTDRVWTYFILSVVVVLGIVYVEESLHPLRKNPRYLLMNVAFRKYKLFVLKENNKYADFIDYLDNYEPKDKTYIAFADSQKSKDEAIYKKVIDILVSNQKTVEEVFRQEANNEDLSAKGFSTLIALGQPPKRGRQSGDFITYINGDQEQKEKVLSRLHELIDDKKGKGVALVIFTAIKMGLMVEPTFRSIKEEFKNVGTSSGYNKYMNGGQGLFARQEQLILGMEKQLEDLKIGDDN